MVSQERSDGLNTRSTLQVLGGEQLVEVFLEGGASSVCSDVENGENPHKDLFKTFEVPVLVDNGVDDS